MSKMGDLHHDIEILVNDGQDYHAIAKVLSIPYEWVVEVAKQCKEYQEQLLPTSN